MVLILSINCIISCLTFFELSLFSVRSPNNSATVFLKVVPFVLKMQVFNCSSSYFFTLQIFCSVASSDRGFSLICTGQMLVQWLDLFYYFGLLASHVHFLGIFRALPLHANFRSESLCFRLFIQSIGTKSLYTLLDELFHLLCHFLKDNFEFFVLISDVNMLYVSSTVLLILAAMFGSSSAVSLPLISFWTGK